MRKIKNWSLSLILLAGLLGGCASRRPLTMSVNLKENFVGDRVVDVIRIKKVVGRKSFLLLFRKNKYSYFLEGYIKGMITDYDSNPISGIEVRAEVTGAGETPVKKQAEELVLAEETEKQTTVAGTVNFDPGLSDANGFYRVRFNFAIIKDKVDIRGKLIYNPSWVQQHDVLGQAYEPQIKESEFRLYYNEDEKILVLVEGLRKAIVRPVRNPGKAASPLKLPGSEKPETVAPAKKAEKKGEDEFFKGFQ